MFNTVRQHYGIIVFPIIIGVLYPTIKYYNLWPQSASVNSNNISVNDNTDKLFTKEELAKYNGLEGSKGLYLAIMGSIYDVQKGSQHYGVGGTYHFFVGRDASSVFISGDFKSEEENLEDILHLEPKDLISLKQWKEFYNKDYTYVGKLIGLHYDENGVETDYVRKVNERIEEGQAAILRAKELEEQFPPCNIEWKVETGTKVWCSYQSGGVLRNWIGVPRKYYETGKTEYRCACIQTEKIGAANLQTYDNCDDLSDTCYFKPDN